MQILIKIIFTIFIILICGFVIAATGGGGAILAIIFLPVISKIWKYKSKSSDNNQLDKS